MNTDNSTTSYQILRYLQPMQGPGPAAHTELRMRQDKGLVKHDLCDGWGWRYLEGKRCDCSCGGLGMVKL